MPDLNKEQNLVEVLRSKTEKDDLNLILKSTIGGYTKKSVLAYLNVLRKQQQQTVETFSRNQQSLFEEKEALKKENDALASKLSQLESEYRNLSNRMHFEKFEKEDLTIDDISSLKAKITALEQELNRSSIDQSKLSQELKQQKALVQELQDQLEQVNEEKASLKEMLKAEMLESSRLRSTTERLNATIEENEEEIKFLESLISTGQVANLTERINELMQELSSQTEMISQCNSKIDAQAQTIEILTQENTTLKEDLTRLSKTTESYSEQNDKLLFANKSLSDLLEQEHKRSIAMIKEKSGLTMDKLSAVKKLDEAHSKIAMLELQLQKLMNERAAGEISQKSEEAEKVNIS